MLQFISGLIAAESILDEGKIAVVQIRGRDKLYSYFMQEEFEIGDDVRVPVKEGGPLVATIRKITSAKRYKNKATRTIIERV